MPVLRRVLDEEGDGDGRSAAAAEDLAAFLARLLAGGALVAAQVVDVDGRELVGERLAHAVGGVAVEPAAVGDEGDDAPVPDPQRGPPDRADVGVVERSLIVAVDRAA